MGVPLSNYTVLKYLADSVEPSKRNRESIAMELAIDSLKNYSVFAFIIHDPVLHKDFHELLEKQFRSLHNSSGEHLVFFGLVDSPKKHCLVGKTPFYTDVRDMVELYESEERNKIDPSYSAFAIANSLNIQPDMLPAIVVTHDTRLKSYRWYKTCPDKIETQMSRLTSISYDMFDYKNKEQLTLDDKQNILYNLLDDAGLDLCKGMGTTRLTESMARALSDLLSFLIQQEKDSAFFRRERRTLQISNQQQNYSLIKLVETLKHLKLKLSQAELDDVDNSPIFFARIEELSIKLAIYLSLLHKKSHVEKINGISFEKNWLEPHSYHLYKTALEVKEFLHRKDGTIDYSPSAICFAKMFENEINYSLVHWVRQQYSIQLPDFFNKVQPGVQAVVPVGDQGYSVDLNSKRRGEWLPPEIGKSKNLARFSLTKENWDTMGIHNPKLFLTEWDKMHKLRNKAAHPHAVSYLELSEMQQSLSNLAQNQVFEKLANIKNSFKNSPA
ncbi:hypothetical protein BTR23_09750 [Alkalihalophilus pseudofirmus]|nr:hypothetical protein BTR23_09750 [Alkalihalophilus pseudofirmus]